MEKNKVSVIVPVYNAEKFLDRCINSIIKQSYKNLEIILIDDGSIDKSADIMKKYEKKDNRIITYFQNNFGAPSARNRGIEMSIGEYIIFFDADDELYENAIENLVGKMKDVDIVIGGFEEIDETGKRTLSKCVYKNEIYNKDSLKYIVELCPMPGHRLFRSKIIKDNKIFWDNVRIEQDTNFYIKYIGMSSKYATIDSMIFKYRHSPKSISRTYGLNLIDTITSINKAVNFLKRKSNELDDSIIMSIKLIHYINKIKLVKLYDKRFRNVILDSFFYDLKETNKNNTTNELKKEYKKMLIKCKLFKYGFVIFFINIVRRLKGKNKL